MAERELSLLMTLQDNVSKDLSRVKGRLEGMRPTFNKMAKWGTVAFATISGAVLKSIQTFAEFEQVEVAFESMLGSAEKAKIMMEELEKFSAKTPFQFKEIADATRVLVGFGSSGEEAREQIKMLGDISAGAQIPLTDMSSIFGKVQTKGKAMTEEIMQMAERGIPIIDVLAEQFDVSKEAIFEMASQGEISADVVNDALKSMTTEGGMFEDQMKKQSETLAGQFSTLKDNIQLAMKAIGDVFDGEIKGMIGNVTDMVGNLKEWIEENPKLTKVIILATLAITGLVAILGILGIILPAVATGFAMITGPIGLIIVAIIALIAFAVKVIKNWSSIVDGFTAIWEGVKGAFLSAWEWIKNMFMNYTVYGLVIKHWSGITEFFANLWDGVTSIFSDAKDFIMNIVNEILGFPGRIADAVKSIPGLESFVSKAGSAIGVNDAMITSKGDVVKFHPDDNILAMKDFGNLGSGGSTVVNVTVKDGMYLDRDAGRQLARVLSDELQREIKLAN